MTKKIHPDGGVRVNEASCSTSARGYSTPVLLPSSMRGDGRQTVGMVANLSVQRPNTTLSREVLGAYIARCGCKMRVVELVVAPKLDAPKLQRKVKES